MLPHHLSSQVSAYDKKSYRYPAELRQQVLAAPQAPGVYTFHGIDHNFPLYIGKSINLRSRLLSHLRTEGEARLLRQTKHISYTPMAGGISALLLEAEMIKQQRPLFNRRLRKTKDTCSFVLTKTGLEINYTSKLIHENKSNIFGLFKSQRVAKDRLRELADQHSLCLGIIGIEPLIGDRGCFRASLKKCAGACCGKEDITAHHQRLIFALNNFKVALWPYNGPVALKESFGRLKQYHLLDNWHYQGSYKSLRGLNSKKPTEKRQFDADMYKILVKPILSGEADIIEL